MKVRLLKRLRKKYAKKYCIAKASGGCWKLWYGNHEYDYYLFSSIENAKEAFISHVRNDILYYLMMYRDERGRRHGIKYYPWIVLLFFVIPANAQTKQQVLAEIKRQNIPHPEIVLAQARLESGNFKSPPYKDTNNLFGIKENGKYVRYKDWRKSVRDYKEKISSKYIKRGRGNYYEFIQGMGYAKDPEYINKLKSCVK